MTVKKSRFALFFGNRGFFPASHQAGARKELKATLKNLGHTTISLPVKATRYGAVETPAEGEIYADFLKENRNRYDGVILCLPNFGDETGAIAALKDCGVPILIQAYPDDLDKMAPEFRRDAFCGKFSIMDVFCQHGLKFTSLPPHVVSPASESFEKNIDYFDRLCRVTRGMTSMVVGAVGARTTAFKTVRIDEIALQRHGITMETLDLSDIFSRVHALSDTAAKVRAKQRCLTDYTSFDGVPDESLTMLSKLGVVLDEVVKEYAMNCLSIRCWIEMQEQLKVSPCVLASEMNDRGIPVACEVDAGNAVAMYALHLASGNASTCLDWNNNYGDESEKCILFHCGPVPQSMMTARGQVVDHAILVKVLGAGCGWGCNSGRIASTPITFGSLLTEGGRLKFFLGQGRFTSDPIPDDFFGCAGVAQVNKLQEVLQTIGYSGYRHHVSVTPGHIADPVREAFERYLGYDVESV